ncbi:receptor-like protein EIX1 [Bidens hawaiensis]|uniref:receptor-like protein EIX1 n=1 Tax=Bidens hawaiensis TaxID=980011 RepID=UPI00404933DB
MGLHLIFLSIFLFTTKYTCLGAQYSIVSCHEPERLALLKLKDGVKDDFNMLSSWVGVDCCSWDRVRCDSATGRAVGLHLRGNAGKLSYSCWVAGISKSTTAEDDYTVGEDHYLVGEDVNSSLAELRYLKYLDLSGNDFQGWQISEFIGSLKQLSYLNLSNAGFSGNIPHHIGNISNLKVLDLSSTTHTQTLTVDDLVWISGLLSLEYLDLNGVNLSGAKNRDMVFYMIPSVIHLSLSCCGFSNVDLAGPHLNFSRMLPNIEHLHLRENAIKGRFPSVLTNMSSLVSLGLSGNLLNSSIPFMPSLLKLDLSYNNIRLIDHIGIWRRCNLKELIVSDSNLEGEMHGPSTNESICSQYALEVLDLSGNELSGLIPKSLGMLTSLRALYLASNILQGPIPKALGRLIILKALYLSYNQLDGPIPTFVGQLTELDLSYNNLNYSIPKSFGSLAYLTYLNLECNQLTGPIPASLGTLVSLKAFSVSSNMLNGTIPVSIGQLSKLTHLDVSNNYLEGVVSEAHFSNLSLLKYLDLSSNRNLIFNVSREWIPPFQLITIRLGSCNISNDFPMWILTQKKLVELVLSNASISGPLPMWLRQMPIIRALDLSYNNLNGSLGNLPFKDRLNGFKDEYMGSLYMQNNLFSGLIPRSLCTRTDLEILDLSKNRLTGEIPNCLVNLKNLGMMMFSSNELSGAIPSFSGRTFPMLSWLNLNNNNFTESFLKIWGSYMP